MPRYPPSVLMSTPSVELSVNRLDKVVSITAYNADGQALADALDIQFWDYADAVRQIVESDVIQGCLQRDETLSIAVAGSDKEKTGEMLLEHRVLYCRTRKYLLLPGPLRRNNSGPRRRASLWEIPRLFAASGSRSQHYARRGKRPEYAGTPRLDCRFVGRDIFRNQQPAGKRRQPLWARAWAWIRAAKRESHRPFPQYITIKKQAEGTACFFMVSAIWFSVPQWSRRLRHAQMSQPDCFPQGAA